MMNEREEQMSGEAGTPPHSERSTARARLTTYVVCLRLDDGASNEESIEATDIQHAVTVALKRAQERGHTSRLKAMLAQRAIDMA